MRYLFPLLFPVFLHAQPMQLSRVQIPTNQVFFMDKTRVQMAFDLEGAQIHYSIDKAPAIGSPRYRKPVLLRKSATLKAVATHPSFLQSDVTEKKFVRANYLPKNLFLLTAPDKTYPGSGTTLFDLKKGSRNLHDGNWLGFRADTVTLGAIFKAKIQCMALLISTISDLGSWILSARAVYIFGKNEAGDWRKIGSLEMNSDRLLAEAANYSSFRSIELTPLKTSEFIIKIVPYGPLPDGHPGAGTAAWFFLDEIIFQ